MALIQQMPDGSTQTIDEATGMPIQAPAASVFGPGWRQAADGSWERLSGTKTIATGLGTEYDQHQDIWTAADPFRKTSYDPSQYRDYLEAAGGRLGLVYQTPEEQNNPSRLEGADYYNDPYQLDKIFTAGYGGRSANLNPYGSVAGANALRGIAKQLGLSPDDADQIALAHASQHYAAQGQMYDEYNHPAILADDIARDLFAKAGRTYTGLSSEQRDAYQKQAADYQYAAKEDDQTEWKRDDLGSLAAFEEEWVQSAWEESLKHPNQILAGGVGQGADPFSAQIGNKLGVGGHYDPQINKWGSPSGEVKSKAAQQGVELGVVNGIQWMLEGMAKAIGSSYAGQGIEAGADAAGVGDYAGALKGAASALWNTAGEDGIHGGWQDILKNVLAGAASGGVQDVADMGGLGGIDPAYFGYAKDAYGLYKTYANLQNQKDNWSSFQKSQGGTSGGTSPSAGAKSAMKKRTEDQPKPEGMQPPGGLVDLYALYQQQQAG